MKAMGCLFLVAAALFLTTCGGGGNGDGATSITEFPWFHGMQIAATGEEVLVLTTVDKGNWSRATPATAMHMIAVGATGAIDVTADYFDSAPRFFWARSIVSFTDPVTNQPALWFCSQGREAGPPSVPREQDQLFVMQHGKYDSQSSS